MPDLDLTKVRIYDPADVFIITSILGKPIGYAVPADTVTEQLRGTRDIVVAAMAYVHADPNRDDVEQYWHELEAAVGVYAAAARGEATDAT